jgi:hypothetical protein
MISGFTFISFISKALIFQPICIKPRKFYFELKVSLTQDFLFQIFFMVQFLLWTPEYPTGAILNLYEITVISLYCRIYSKRLQ